MPDAMPANSLKVVEVLPISSTSIASAVSRIPNFSRIRAANPLPVTTPILAAVPCAIIRRTHIIGMLQSVANPKLAPAVEYVAIPPASFPAIAVIIPGPIAARTNPNVVARNFLRGLFSSPAEIAPVDCMSCMFWVMGPFKNLSQLQ